MMRKSLWIAGLLLALVSGAVLADKYRVTIAGLGTFDVDVDRIESPEPEPSKSESPTAEPVPGSRPLVTQADIEYIGSFNVDKHALVSGVNVFSDGGLSHRFADGELRLLMTHHPGSRGVYETNVPEPSLDPDPENWQTARVVHDYGAIGLPLYESIKEGGGQIGSVHWDGGKIIVGSRDVYNAIGANWPSYLVYDPETGESQVLRNEGGLSHPSLGVGCTSIPQWFADKYLGGANLLIGNGYRVGGQGGFNYGPCFAAARIAGDTLVNQRIVQFPPSSMSDSLIMFEPGKEPERRPGNYIAGHAPGHWMHPLPPDANGVGFITANDHVRDSAVWIDLPDKHGLLLMPTLGIGKAVYRYARTESWGGYESYWYVYDPADIAASAQGTRDHWVRAKSFWKFEQKGGHRYYEDPIGTEKGGTPDVRILGATLVDRTLYVLVRGGGAKSGIHTMLGVHVYEIR